MSHLRRNTQGELLAMKQAILDRCISKELKCRDGAQLLKMHPKSFSRLKKRYLQEGKASLVPRKTGPKNKRAPNRTTTTIEDLVVKLANEHSDWGPLPLAESLEVMHQIKVHQSTVWRILKRRHIRYTETYQKIERAKPKLYCLDEPGVELQLDGCYPYGRSVDMVCLDAIDDCSRRVHAKLYPGTETTLKAIDFVDELISVSPFVIKRIRIDNKFGKALDRHCQERGIEVIRNDPYEPTQNGKIERYHKTVKRSFFWMYGRYRNDLEMLRYGLKLWLYYYNGYRRHGGYGMNRQTPNGKIASILVQKLFNSLAPDVYPQKVTLTLQQYKT